MSDIVTFLRARLDEDEAREHAKFKPGRDWYGQPCPTCARAVTGYSVGQTSDLQRLEPCGDYLMPDQVTEFHDLIPDPDARALREVEAKRRILHRYEQFANDRVPSSTRMKDLDFVSQAASKTVFGPVLAALAAVYADHPDCDPSWASSRSSSASPTSTA